MNYKRSILSLSMAQDVMERLPSSRMAGHFEKHGVKLTVRRSIIAGRWTGGYVVVAKTRRPAYGSGIVTFSRRVKPNAPKQVLERYVEYCFSDAYRANLRLVLREELHEYVSGLGLSDNEMFLSAVEAEEKQSGRTSDYESMTDDDVRHWRKWLRENWEEQGGQS